MQFLDVLVSSCGATTYRKTRKSERGGNGAQGVPVSFAGVTFTPGHHLWADADGIVVAERDLTLSS